MLRIILGDFNFQILERYSQVLGPIYFFTYVFFVFFVLVNMFLAIINDSYSEVKSDMKKSGPDLDIGAYFKRSYDNIMKKLHLKKTEIHDMQKILNSFDKNGPIDYEKRKIELKVIEYFI